MLCSRHLQDWLNSGVSERIAQLNATSLDGDRALNQLLIGDVPRRNDGRVRDHILKKVRHCGYGGWWVQGEGEDGWGQFKPDTPRRQDGKLVKYEAPPRMEATAYCLNMTWADGLEIARNNGYGNEYSERILQAYRREIVQALRAEKTAQTDGTQSGSPTATGDTNCGKILPREGICADNLRRGELPEVFQIFLETGTDGSFWQWVECSPNLPITITEGAKKAGALITAGQAAIALPGIWMGQRTPKDSLGQKTGHPHLIPLLKRFAVSGRPFYIAFDSDSNPKTIASVTNAIRSLSYLLKSEGCEVKVMSWSPELGKGIDDVIVNHGYTTLPDLYNRATTLDNWLARSYSRLTYPAHVELNQRYLGALTIPDSCKLVGIKAPKGTGKTERLIEIVAEAHSKGQPVLVLAHRIQLGQALCNRFGLPYVTELKDSEVGKTLGYGLCVDSLHAKSMARFDPNGWDDALIIIDEVEQVLWHTLDSQTCQRERVVILKNLKALIRNAFAGTGRVILSDADLSDVSVDHIKALGGLDVEPYIIRNNWKPGKEHQWVIHSYTGNDPSALVAQAEKELTEGGKLFICCDGQRTQSKWGTQNLEAHFRRLFPHSNILRIDSESVSDPQHPAYGCVAKLDLILPQYDLVIASPSIETGVSIDTRGHFTGVFGIAQGVRPVPSVLQSLARVRDSVPRYIWATKFGRGKIAGGSTSAKELLKAQHELTKANINLLVAADMDELSPEMFQRESLACWAKMAVRINAGMKNYRESILEALKEEGHRLSSETNETDQRTKTQIQVTRELAYQAEQFAIASAQDLTEPEYKLLKDQRAKTKDQRHQERKHELLNRYGLEVTPELVEQDAQKWHPQLRLHYYLTLGKAHVSARDKRVALAQLEAGEGDVWAPAFNSSQLGLKIRALSALGIGELLSSESDLRNSSQELQAIAQTLKAQPWKTKQVLGVTVRQDDTPVAITQRLLKLFGAKLTCIRREGTDGNRVRVYRVFIPDDNREAVFAHWLERDKNQNVSPYTSTQCNKSITTSAVDVKPHQWTLGQKVRVVSHRFPCWNGLVGWIRGLGKDMWIELETGFSHLLSASDIVPA